MAIKEYSTLSISPELEPHHYTQFNVISRTPIFIYVLGCLTSQHGIQSAYSETHQLLSTWIKNMTSHFWCVTYKAENSRFIKFCFCFSEVSFFLTLSTTFTSLYSNIGFCYWPYFFGQYCSPRRVERQMFYHFKPARSSLHLRILKSIYLF